MEDTNNRTLAAPNGTMRRVIVRQFLALGVSYDYPAIIKRHGLTVCPVCGRLANEAGCLDKRCENSANNRRMRSAYGLDEDITTITNNQRVSVINDDRGCCIDAPGCKGVFSL